jgi:uncharacterized membrane protein YdbT with pleckstrin-like domain
MGVSNHPNKDASDVFAVGGGSRDVFLLAAVVGPVIAVLALDACRPVFVAVPSAASADGVADIVVVVAAVLVVVMVFVAHDYSSVRSYYHYHNHHIVGKINLSLYTNRFCPD